LEHADWLWDRLRPGYDAAIRLIGRKHGLPRLINGTDQMFVVPGAGMDETCEPVVWHVMMRLIRAGDTIVDVGANIGIHTVAFAKRSAPDGRVYAFEPDSANLATLHAHIRLNHLEDRVSVFAAAIGATCGEVGFISLSDMVSHIAVDGWRDLYAGRAGETVMVAMKTLDSVFPSGRVDFIKIDVEGFEESVLRGAQTLLGDPARRPRAIVVEVHPFAWEGVGTSSESLLELLTRNGYRVASLAGQPVRHISEYGHIIATAD
jgi:FkbM family methyltransferase